MTLKEFFTHPATIIIGSILIIIGVVAFGKKYWGWFGNNESNERKTNCTDDEQCKKAHPGKNVKCGANGICEYAETNRQVYDTNTESPELYFNISPTVPRFVKIPTAPQPKPTQG